METRSGNLIEPVYQQDAPNAPISLGTHRAEVTLGTLQGTCEVEVEMQFAPRTDLLFRVPEGQLDAEEVSRGDHGVAKKGTESSVRLLGRSITIPTFSMSVSTSVGISGQSASIVMSPVQFGVNALPESDCIHRAVVHVFNFPHFFVDTDDGAVSDQPRTLSTHVNLEVDGWRFTIASMKDSHHREKALKAQGGYHLTHVAQIVRKDSTAFSSQELGDQLTLLHQFLSFALGRWAGVGLTCGYDCSGQMVFEEWGLRHMHPNIRRFASWFEPLRGRMLADVFPGFARLQADAVWREALNHILHWYIAGNDRGAASTVEVQVVHAQIALETLAWTLCVQDKQMLSKNKFKESTAADTVRRLLSSCDIPRGIPGHMSPLLQGKQDGKWSDGPDAIAKLRNHVVHPDRTCEFPPESFLEAGKLALWYVELALLHIAGYTGEYASRLKVRWAGETEPVPWSG